MYSAPWLPGEPHPDPLPRPVWRGGYVGTAPVLADPPEHRQPRRITQLVGSAEGVHALCDDGSVWHLIGGVWAPEPSIPQRQVGGEE